MAERLPVENTSLVRDMHSKALLETSPKQRDEYILKRKMLNRAKETAAKAEAAEAEINTLKEQVSNLTMLVQQLLETKNGAQ